MLRHGRPLKLVCLVKEDTHKRPRILSFYLYEVPRRNKPRETKHYWLPGQGEEELGSDCSMGTGLPFEMMKTVLNLGSSNGRVALQIA